MEQIMRKTLAALAVCGLFVPTALAASAAVESAIKTFDAVAADAAKLKTYCDMSKLMDTADEGADESKSQELDKQMQGYMTQLGSDFQTAFEAGADLDPDSEDGKSYDKALDGLDGKCK
jgi:hypothetical protein